MFKYLLGTAGIGFLYAREELVRELVPTASGWFAQNDIGAMNIFANEPSRTASRFEAGTPPVPSCYAAAAGLGIILEYGVEAIRSEERRVGKEGGRTGSSRWSSYNKKKKKKEKIKTT